MKKVLFPMPDHLLQAYYIEVSAIKDGTTMSITINDAYNLVQLLEGCYTAARQGHEVTF